MVHFLISKMGSVCDESLETMSKYPAFIKFLSPESKGSYHKVATRRFLSPIVDEGDEIEEPSFDKFDATVKEILEETMSVGYSYHDNDGDVVLISTSESLKIALEGCPDSCLKIILDTEERERTVKSLEAEIAQLKSAARALENVNERLRAEVEQEKLRANKELRHKQRLQGDLKGQFISQKALEEGMRRFRLEVQQQKTRADEEMRQRKQMKDDMDAHRVLQEALDKDNQKLRREVEQLRAELEPASKRMEKELKQKLILEKELREVNDSLKALELNKLQYEEEKKTLVAQIESEHRTTEVLLDQMELEQQEAEKLRKDSEMAAERLMKEKSHTEYLAARLAKLKAHVKKSSSSSRHSRSGKYGCPLVLD